MTNEKTQANHADLSLSDRQAFLAFAEEAVSETRKLILDLWQREDFEVDLKSDSTPVTVVDRRAEELVRELLRKKFPAHGIIGEEFGNENPVSEFQWTIDPIDGTQNLANRIPTFGTLLGLRFRDRPVIGIIDHPAMNICLRGGLGLGTYLGDRRVQIADLATTALTPTDLIATSTPDVFERNQLSPLLTKMLALHPYLRMYYDCFSHTMIIQGSLAGMLEANLKIWDVTPTEILCREAGGEFFYAPLTPGLNDYYHAIFGKPKVVALIKKSLGL